MTEELDKSRRNRRITTFVYTGWRRSWIKYIIGWSAGLIVMGFPVLFLYPEFSFGNELWKTTFSVIIIYSTALLLFEILFKNLFMYSFAGQTTALAVLFISSEIEFSYLPVAWTQIEYFGDQFSSLIFLLFAILAAYLVSRKTYYRKRPVIIRKEV